MWKKLYIIGLALPRVLFKPLREFKIVVPKSGRPFVITHEQEASITEMHGKKLDITKKRDFSVISLGTKRPSIITGEDREDDEEQLMYQILEDLNTIPIGKVLKKIASLPTIRKEKLLEIRQKLSQAEDEDTRVSVLKAELVELIGKTYGSKE